MTLSKGTYRARGITGALGFTNNGNPQVAVRLQITDQAHSGETITWYGYFTDNTTERTLDSLRILGWAADELSDLTGIDANEVEIVVDEEEYNGQQKLRVRWINEIRGPLVAPMTADQLRVFSAKMKGAAVAAKRRATAKPGQTQTPASGAPRKPASDNASERFNDPYYTGQGSDEPEPF